MSTKKRPNSRRPDGTAAAPRPDRTTRPTVSPARPVRRDADDDLDARAAAAEQFPPTGAVYPQVLRTADHKWWRSLIGAVLAIALFVTLVPVIIQLVVGIGWAVTGRDGSYRDYYATALRFDLPTGMLATNLGLALLTPIAVFLAVFVHRVRPGWVASVRPGIRRSYLAWTLPLAALALGAVLALSLLVKPLDHFGPQPGFWGFLVVIVLTSPLQALGEEVFFRGYLMQALGSLVANPWFGVVASSVIFAAFHGIGQSPALFVDRLAFGLLAALLVLKTGGLEAGIAAHVINNVFAFTLAGLTSTIAAARGLTSIGWIDAAFDVGGFALFALLAWLLARKMRLQTRVGESGGSGLGEGGLVR